MKEKYEKQLGARRTPLGKLLIIMKTTVFLMLVGLLQVSAVTYSQNANLTVYYKQAIVSEVFADLEENTQYSFVYRKDDLDLGKKINYEATNKNIFKILDDILEGQDLSYRVNDRIVIITSSNADQEKNNTIQGKKDIKGSVTDESGFPLPGVTVLIKGTTNGTVTDVNGTYSLNVSEGAILLFSYIGYSDQEITVGAQSVIDVQMKTDVAQLEDVVVVGYKTVKKSDVSGSIASVSGEELSRIKSPSAGQALQGMAPGVYVKNNSGQPGGGISVRIRGMGGLNNSEPLYIVDGRQISPGESENSNALTIINPNDIESIEVLKDASTTAIYGSRAANGVVVITTKRGNTDGSASVSLSASYGVQTIANYGGFEVLNASEYASVTNAILEAAGLPAQFDGSDELFPTPENLGAGTNHIDAITQTAAVKEYQLSVRGGNNKTQYFTSLNYLDQEGVIKTTSFDQIRFRLNLDTKVNDWFKLGANITANHGTQTLVENNNRLGEGGVWGRSLTYTPTIPLFNDDGTYAGPESSFYPPTRTSLSRLENREGGLTSSAANINIFAELKLMEGLSFRTRLVGGLNTSKNPRIIPIWEEGINNSAGLATLSNTVTNGGGYQWSNVLTYTRSFGDHNVLGLAGIEARESQSNSIYAYSEHNNDQDKLIGLTGTNDDFRESKSSASYASYFGNVSYNYKSKYYFDASIRRDGSWNFSENNRWGVFPSVSAAWRISEEDFFDVSFINELKLRGSYGEVGNDKVPGFQYILGTRNNINYAFGDMTGQAINGRAIDDINNEFIRWETSVQKNIGLDVAMLDNRLTFSAEYFKTDITDMLLAVGTAGVSGTSNVRPNGIFPRTVDVNAGELTNSGLEFDLAFTTHITDGLKLNVGGNLTTFNNEVTDISTNSEIYGATWEGQNVSRTVVGGSVGDFYGFVVEGLFQTQEEIDALNVAADVVDDPTTIQDETEDRFYQAAGTAPGDFKYKDINGDGTINDDDRTTIGSPTPDFTYGLNLGLSYKGFDFSMLWYGVQGADVFNASRINLEASSRAGYNKSKTVLNAWTPENTNTLIPRRHADDPNNNKRVSSAFVEDGSFLALRNVSLGYTLPDNIASRLKMSRVRVYVTGQNLLVFTKYSGFDPEVGNIGGSNQGAGIDNSFYPKARRYDVGIDITF